MNNSQLEIPINHDDLQLADLFVREWILARDLSQDLREKLSRAVTKVLGLLVSKNENRETTGTVQIRLSLQKEDCFVEFLNLGLPLYLSDFYEFSNQAILD